MTTKRSSKKTLPPFGFADDLLKQRSRVDPEPPAGPAAGSEAIDRGETAAAKKPPTKGAAARRAKVRKPEWADAEDRIFRFADSLEAGDEEKPRQEAPQRLETCLTLSLGSEVFALPVRPVREVLRLSSITRVPHAPRPIRGVTNLRGRVIPVIDLRRRLQLPETDVTRSTRVVVVSSRGRLLGLLADAVHQVVHIDLNQVQSPPDDVMTIQSDYIQGVYHLGEKLILLLDVDRTLIIREGTSQDDPRATARKAS